VRLPVFLRRHPEEAPDIHLQRFYKSLLQAIRSTDFRDGEWKLCERSGWPDNHAYPNLVAWCWAKDQEHHLIVVNLLSHRPQGNVRIPVPDLAGRMWRMTDTMNGAVFDRDGRELDDTGLYVDLEAWGFHVLTF
jgi:hypothetical protein